MSHNHTYFATVQNLFKNILDSPTVQAEKKTIEKQAETLATAETVKLEQKAEKVLNNEINKVDK